jgi:crotonobetainyl-CoA:carnitine CoA-transferase CaiB-like acyl-CoA transferase
VSFEFESQAVQSVEEVLEDPQAGNAWVDIPRGGGEEGAPFRSVASSVDFNGQVCAPGPVAQLGEHTREVLAEAGLSEEEISAVAAVRARL